MKKPPSDESEGSFVPDIPASASFDELSDMMKVYRELVDTELDRLLPPADAAPAIIHQAMRHSIFSGGKRLRPFLVLMSCEMCGGDPRQAMTAACAMEMIHTYSLIHDDLPAMDDDDFRRGNPTCHKVYGEALAILAGDALLTYAFEVLAREVSYSGILIGEIAAAAGTRGMIGGQVVDITSEKLPPDAELVGYIHRCKTAALISQSVRTGAVIAGAHDNGLASVTEYGENIGLAFQVVDDILDISGTAEQLGKTVGKDEASGKQTYPAVYGLEPSKQKAAELVQHAKSCLSSFGERARGLCALADFITARNS